MKCNLNLRSIFLVSFALGLMGAQPLWADGSLTFLGYAHTINTGGSITLSSPSDLVVDSSGDVFIVDTGNSRIVEVNAQGTASVLTISGLSPALSSPSGIAIDGSENLYVADTGNSRVVKVSSSGAGSVIGTGSVTLSSPQGVALDQSGDIFIADTGNLRIVEVTSGGSAAVLSITVSSGPSTLSSPKGLAVNVSGTLYIADSGNNRIVVVAAGSTTGAVVSIAGGVTLNGPTGVAVDRIGNIFVADRFNNRITEVDTSGNGNVLDYAQDLTLNGPLGVALNVFGTVYIADTGNSRGLIADPFLDGNPEDEGYTSSLNKSAVGFGHITLGSSTPTSLILSFTTGTDEGLGGVNVFTSGTQGLDFQIVSGSNTTCNGTTPPSTLCTVEVSFLPTAPGLRTGSVVLYDPELNPILTLPLYGWADSPVAALGPNTGSVINTGGLALDNPYQVALDGAGDMYVGDYSGMNVTKIPAGGGSASVVNLGTPGDIPVQNITGVALDGAGNLYIGDHENSRILVVTPGGVVSVLNITGLSPTLGFPVALAFDGAGNLYIADFTNSRIVEVSRLQVAGSTSTGIGTVIGTGSYSFSDSTLTGLTVDLQGNIYAAARTQNNSSIVKVTAAGVASLLSIPSNITPAINNPQGVAVDAMGNVYIVDTGNSRIVEITTAGVGSALSLTVLPSPTTLGSLTFGVTVDASGNLYIPDWTNNRVVFVNVSGAALTFATTGVGSTSTDSPKTATVTNLGNQALAFSANPTYTANFSENTSDTNLCTSSTSLLPGALCDVSVDFTPQSAGSLSAGITVTNNDLNVSGSTQQVSVSGTATAAVAGVAPTSLTFASQLINTTSAAQSVTVSNTGAASLTIASIALSGANSVDFGETNTCGGAVAASSSCTISVTFKPTATGTRTATLTVTDDSNGVSGSTQAVSLSGTATSNAMAGLAPTSLTFASQSVGTTSSAQSVTLTNSGGAALTVTNIALSGANSADFGETNTCGSSVAASGSCTISVTFKPTAAGARTATLTVTDNSNGVSGSTQTVSLTGTGTAVPVVSLSPTSLTFSSQTVNTTSSAQSVTLTNAGNAALTITSITASGDFVTINTCGASVAAGASCTISVEFKPTAAGTRTGALTLTDSASPGTQTFNLTGTGTAVPVVSLSPTSLTFGSQSASSGATVSTAGQTVTLTNTGTGALTVTSITATGPFAATNTCGTSVTAGANCAVIVTFKPTASGTQTGSVVITDNAAGSPQTITLSGTTPYVTLSTGSVTLPGAPVGISTGSETVTVTNDNNTKLAITSITLSPSTFAETNTCGSSLAAGASCKVTITFTATVAGVTAGQLSIVDNAPGGPQVVSLTGIGQDFTLGPYNLTQTVAPGGATSYDLRLAPVEGYSQPIQLTCSGAPAQSTCTLTPSSVTLNAGEDHSTILLQVTTTEPSRLVRAPLGPMAGHPRLKPGPALWVLLALLGILVVAAARADRRRMRQLVPLMLLLGAVVTWAACGSGTTTFQSPSGGTPAGTYSVTVTATSGKIAHSMAVQLTVS